VTFSLRAPALFLLFAALTVGCRPAEAVHAEQASAAAPASTIPLIIRSAKGARTFQVEVARTPAEQAKGLMYRTSLAPDAGMIFLFDPPEYASFWMKNTYIPLDMLFIRTDGTIARIAANTTPRSLEPVSAGELVGTVLEIAGGRAAELGIREGDRVSWPGGPG
jgi:uncharacterized membrane protein (UPF0127 family)